VTSENRFDLGSVKYKIVKLKGGGVKTYKSVHVTDFNWDGYVIYAGITRQDTPGSDFDPVSVNENGQFIGSDVGPSSIGSVRSSVIKWGEGNQTPQEFGAEGTGLVITNAKDILTLNPEGVPLIWRRRPDNPEVYQKESVDLGDIADKWNLQAMLMNTDRVLAGLGTKIKDDQNNPISSPSPEPVLLVPAELAVDANRDGTITLASDLNPDPELSDQTTEKKPFFFPINDDDDNPGTTPQADYINTVVDGADDLKDFFPVFLDIKQLLTVLPPSDSVKYKLKQADGALNFVYTSLTRATAFDYKTAGPSSTGYGAGGSLPATFATTIPITSSGVELNGYFLDRIKNQDKGVILVEGRTSSVQPLVLTVEKDGVSITEISLHLMPIEIITINTFIPHNNVDDPDNLNPLNIASPAHVYGGDDRSSGSPLRAIWNKEGAHRSRQRFKIVPLRNRGDTDGIEDNSYINDTDGVRNDSLLNDVGATHKYHKASSLNASGNLTAAAKSDTILGDENLMVAKATASKYSGMEIIPEWISDNKLKVTCTLSLGNPLAPVIAGNQIDYVFILTLDYSDPKHPLYSLEGSHDGFPAYEVYIGGKRIYEHDPLATGEDVFSLLGSGEWDVNETTNHMNQTLR
ncbi:MAG: hypothetical protein NTU80_02125, partial [Verrucomicrobia bacterium]|nr:hypothetical protein [Verrucomicrobiota bacterium]